MSTHFYKKYIHKDQVSNYPLGFFEGTIIFFNSLNAEEQKKLILDIQNQNILGIDTETKPSFQKGVQNRMALLQLYYPDKVVLFQLHRFSLPFEIKNILEDVNITKIGIGLQDDSRGLRRDYQCDPQGMLDLNSFAKRKGFQSIGVQKLSALVLGIFVNKKEQLSNWERIPLSKSQQIYAATDAWVAYAIYQKIKIL